jgi:hypothetical protein
MDLEQLFIDNKEQSITGRYLPLESIEPILQRLNTDNQLSVVGKSVAKPIYRYQIGEGKNKNIALVSNARK